MNYVAFAGISEIDNLYVDAQRNMKIRDKLEWMEEQEEEEFAVVRFYNKSPNHQEL